MRIYAYVCRCTEQALYARPGLQHPNSLARNCSHLAPFQLQVRPALELTSAESQHEPAESQNVEFSRSLGGG